MAETSDIVDRLDKIAKIMAMQLVAEADQDDKRRTLAALGYTATEIATLLQEKTNTVQKFLNREREAAKPKPRKSTAIKPRKQ